MALLDTFRKNQELAPSVAGEPTTAIGSGLLAKYHANQKTIAEEPHGPAQASVGPAILRPTGAEPPKKSQAQDFSNVFPTKHPMVENDDGTRSNVVLGGAYEWELVPGGSRTKAIVYPTMVDGKQLTDDEAKRLAAQYIKGGATYPTFNSMDEADAWAKENHANIPPPQEPAQAAPKVDIKVTAAELRGDTRSVPEIRDELRAIPADFRRKTSIPLGIPGPDPNQEQRDRLTSELQGAEEIQKQIMDQVVSPRVSEIWETANTEIEDIKGGAFGGYANPFMKHGTKGGTTESEKEVQTSQLRALVDEASAYMDAGVEAPFSYARRKLAVGEWVDKLPFSPTDLVKMVEINRLAQKHSEGGELSDLERAKLEQFAADQLLQKTVRNTMGSNVATGIIDMLPYMAEFALTGGLAKAARIPGRKLLLKQARKATAQSWTRKGLFAARRVAQGLSAATARTAINPDTYAMVVENKIGNIKLVPGAPDGESAYDVVVEGDGHSWGRAMADAYVTQVIEMSSEESGKLIGKALEKIPGIGKLFRAISIDAFRKANPTANLSKTIKFLDKIGKQGVFEEYTEERWGAVMREVARHLGLLKDQDKAEGAEDLLKSAFHQSTEEFLTELGVLAGGMGTAAAPAQVVNTVQSARATSRRNKAEQALFDMGLREEIDSVLDEQDPKKREKILRDALDRKAMNLELMGEVDARKQGEADFKNMLNTLETLQHEWQTIGGAPAPEATTQQRVDEAMEEEDAARARSPEATKEKAKKTFRKVIDEATKKREEPAVPEVEEKPEKKPAKKKPAKKKTFKKKGVEKPDGETEALINEEETRVREQSAKLRNKLNIDEDGMVTVYRGLSPDSTTGQVATDAKIRPLDYVFPDGPLRNGRETAKEQARGYAGKDGVVLESKVKAEELLTSGRPAARKGKFVYVPEGYNWMDTRGGQALPGQKGGGKGLTRREQLLKKHAKAKESQAQESPPPRKKKKAPKKSVVAGQEIETNPSEKEKESGVYKKGHAQLDGLDISIENPVGSTREGTDKGGKKWKQEVHSDYGYIKGTVGRDKDHVDVFVSPGYDGGAGTVFVVNQVAPNQGRKFDEHKVMLGFETEEEATAAYNANYEKGWKGLGSVVAMTPEAFKSWVYSDKDGPVKGRLSEARRKRHAKLAPAVAPAKTPPKDELTQLSWEDLKTRAKKVGVDTSGVYTTPGAKRAAIEKLVLKAEKAPAPAKAPESPEASLAQAQSVDPTSIEFSEDEQKVATKTGQVSGAVGQNPATPRWVAKNVEDKAQSVLDFGAGRAAHGSKMMRDAGFESVTAYDFPANRNEKHDENALKRRYDVVVASNVINVQTSEDMLHRTLTQVAAALSPEGTAYLNFPATPRKTDLTTAQMAAALRKHFWYVRQVGGTRGAPIFEARHTSLEEEAETTGQLRQRAKREGVKGWRSKSPAELREELDKPKKKVVPGKKKAQTKKKTKGESDDKASKPKRTLRRRKLHLPNNRQGKQSFEELRTGIVERSESDSDVGKAFKSAEVDEAYAATPEAKVYAEQVGEYGYDTVFVYKMGDIEGFTYHPGKLVVINTTAPAITAEYEAHELHHIRENAQIPEALALTASIDIKSAGAKKYHEAVLSRGVKQTIEKSASDMAADIYAGREVHHGVRLSETQKQGGDSSTSKYSEEIVGGHPHPAKDKLSPKDTPVNMSLSSLYSDNKERRIERYGQDLTPIGVQYSLTDEVYDRPDMTVTDFGSVRGRLGLELEIALRLAPPEAQDELEVMSYIDTGYSGRMTATALPQDLMAHIYKYRKYYAGLMDRSESPLETAKRLGKVPDADLEVVRLEMLKPKKRKPKKRKPTKRKPTKRKKAPGTKSLSEALGDLYKSKAISTESINTLRDLVAMKGTTALLSDNAKAVTSTNMILATCDPSGSCLVCYAATAFNRMSNVRKAFRTTIYALTDPLGWAETVAAEAAKVPKYKLPFIRLQGSGDLTLTELIDAYNHLAQVADRPIQIFSRHHPNLAKLKGTAKAPFLKMGSIDAQLYKAYGLRYLKANMDKRGIANSFLYTDESEIPAMLELNKRNALELILAAKPELHEKLPKELRMKSCPCDAEERTYVMSCPECAMSQAGCFMAFANKGVDINGKIWNFLDPKAPMDLAPLTVFTKQKDIPKAWANIASTIIKKSANLITAVDLPGWKKGQKKRLPMKDVRRKNDVLYLWVEKVGDEFAVKAERQGKIETLRTYKTNKAARKMVERRAADFIKHLDNLSRRALQEQTFWLPGGEIQPAVGVRDGRVRGSRTAKKIQKGEEGTFDVGAGLQYSLGDKAYLEAVESGDTATAQRMVDEAAKAGGVRIVREGPDVALEFKGATLALRFGESERWRDVWPDDVVDNLGTGTLAVISAVRVPENLRKQGVGRTLTNLASNIAASRGAEYVYLKSSPLMGGADPTGFYNRLGYEEIGESSDGSPIMSKSADPVTRDDQGKVIPLSERFTESPDIRFSLQDKPGKRVGGTLYIEAGQVEQNAKPEEAALHNQTKGAVADFEHDIVSIDTRGNKVRYLKMNSLEDPHPVVAESRVVSADGEVTPGRTAGQIYHRMETILSPSHPRHSFYRHVTAYEESVGALGPFTIHGKSPSGSRAVWEKQVNADAEVSYEQLQAELGRIGDRHSQDLQFSLSGEWWIDGGSATFADGDVGDYNHEAVATETAQAEVIQALQDDEVLSEMVTDVFGELGDYESFDPIGSREAMINWTDAAQQDGRLTEEQADDIYAFIAERTGLDEETVSVALGVGDARVWGMKQGGVRVAGSSIETWTITSEQMRDIANGLWDAYGDNLESDPTFNVEVHATGKTYYGVPYSVIEKRNPAALREFELGNTMQFSLQDRPLWYSPVAKAIDALKQAKGSAAQFKAMLAKSPGVKAQEMEESGLNDWLDVKAEAGAKVTKDELKAFADANGVQIKEVEKGGSHETWPDFDQYDVETDDGELFNIAWVDTSTRMLEYVDHYPDEVRSDYPTLDITDDEVKMLRTAQELAEEYTVDDNEFQGHRAGEDVDVVTADILRTMGGLWTARLPSGNYKIVSNKQGLLELSKDDELLGTFGSLDEAQDWVHDEVGAEMHIEDIDPNATEHGDYQLPGGEDYRELLLTLPEVPEEERKVFDIRDRQATIQAPVYTADTLEEAQNWITENAENWRLKEPYIQRTTSRRRSRQNFMDSHFDEPNVLAHIRFNERTAPVYNSADLTDIGRRLLEAVNAKSEQSLGSGAPEVGVRKGLVTQEEADAYMVHRGFNKYGPDGKVVDLQAPSRRMLFIEEIQSDWHQKGREKGYATSDYNRQVQRKAELTAEIQRRSMVAEERRNDDKFDSFAYDQETNELIAEKNRLVVEGQLAVPDAPFKGNAWKKLALRRMIKYAADNGFDSIGWTTGQQQFERWGSEEVSWEKSGKGWRVYVTAQTGGTAGGVDIENEARIRGILKEEKMRINTKEQLHMLVGEVLPTTANIAKIVDRAWDRMQTEPIGTSLPRKEGMQRFYDQELRNLAKDIVRKMDKSVRVGESEVETGDGLTAPRKYVGPQKTRAEMQAIASDFHTSTTIASQAQEVADDMHRRSFDEVMSTMSEILAEHVGGKLIRLPLLAPIHSLPITDKMREKAEAGMPQYSLSDKTYLEAVEAGDMATAQRMVDEAAKAAGYGIKAYHGTPVSGITKLKRGDGSRYTVGSLGTFLSSSKSYASEYATGKDAEVIEGYIRLNNPKQEGIKRLSRFTDASDVAQYRTTAIKEGHDGVEFISPGPTEYVVFSPSQIKSADPVTYKDGKPIPLSERFDSAQDDIRFSLGDKTYLEAVEAGDTAKAQEMVDEAAKAAGYAVGPVFHGTRKQFTVFNESRKFDSGKGKAFWFIDNEVVASGFGPTTLRVFLAEPVDVVEQEGEGRPLIYKVQKPSQIKSAEAVTRDDAGKVIPLSERFQAESPDIRYSLGDKHQKYDVKLTFEYPAHDERDGIDYEVLAKSKSEAIKEARSQASDDGHTIGGRGQYWFKAELAEDQPVPEAGAREQPAQRQRPQRKQPAEVNAHFDGTFGVYDGASEEWIETYDTEAEAQAHADRLNAGPQFSLGDKDSDFEEALRQATPDRSAYNPRTARQRLLAESTYKSTIGSVLEEVDKSLQTDEVFHSGIPVRPSPRGRVRSDSVPDGAWKIDDPAVEGRLEKAHGMKAPKRIHRVIAGVANLWHKMTRPQSFIPQNKKYAMANEGFRLLKNVPDQVQDMAIRAIAGITDALGANEFALFERLVLMENLVAAVERNNPLRFGIKYDQAVEYREKLRGMAEQAPRVKEAMNLRRKILEGVRDDLVGFGIISEEASANWETYFRQQVLTYMHMQRAPVGRTFNKKKASFTKRRVTDIDELGEEYDYNSSYLEAEAEYLMQALHEIEKEKLLRNHIDGPYNIIKKLKAQAKERNLELAHGGADVLARVRELQAEIRSIKGQAEANGEPLDSEDRKQLAGLHEELNAIDVLQPFRIRITRAKAVIAKLLKNGDIDVPPQHEAAAYLLQQAFRKKSESNDVEIDLEEADGSFFEFINWLARQEGDESNPAKGIFKAVADKKAYIKEKAGKEFATWQRMIPEDHQIWQPAPGNVWFKAHTVPEQLAEQLQKAIIDSAEITKDDLRELVAVGPKREQMVLPTAIVRQLGAMNKVHSSAFGSMWREMHKDWKVWTLFNPKRALAYNIRNMTGDVDPVIAAQPSILKHFGRATQELWKYYHSTSLALSPMLEKARDLGVIGSTLTSQEIPDLNELAIFNHLYKNSSPATLATAPAWYFEKVKQYSEFRESLLRYAAFLDYMDKLKKGQRINYGGAKAKVVDGLVGNELKAAHLARNLLGDYGDMTEMGTWLRRNLIPFWSWMEVNMKRYPRLVVNAFKTGGAKRGFATQGLIGLSVLMRIGAMYAGQWLWNHLMFPDEEEMLAGYDRANPHVILGRDDDGSILVFRNVGALGDYLEWYGINDLLVLWPQYKDGQIELKDLALEMGKAPVNKMVQGLRPEINVGVTMITGKSLFPDAFQPRTAERGLAIPQAFGLQDEFNYLRRELLKSGDAVRPGAVTRAFVGRVDYRQAALSDLYDLRGKFRESKGKSVATDWKLTEWTKVRRAAAYNDREAFDQALEKYYASGKTIENLKKSIKRLDPMTGVTKANRDEFEQEFLNSVQRKKLHIARNFALDLGDRILTWTGEDSGSGSTRWDWKPTKH